MEELSYIQDGVEATEELDKNLLVLRLSLGKLEAALTRAFAPLFNLVLPGINRAVNQVASFINDVAAVVGSLFGFVRKTAAKTVKASGTAVKRSLAKFDELERIGTGKGGSGVTVLEGQIIALPDRLKPALEKLRQLLSPLMDIDFSAAAAAFGRLRTALEPLTRGLFSGLEWAWFNLLVPMAKWGAEQALPAFLDALAAGARVLGATVEAVKPLLSWLWSSLLEPMSRWTGALVTEGLRMVAGLLQTIAGWLEQLKPHTEAFAAWLDNLWRGFLNLTGSMEGWNKTAATFGNVLGTILDLVLRVGNAFSGIVVLIASVKTGLTGMSGGVVGGIKNAVNTAIGAVNGAIRAIQGAINAMVASLNSIQITVPSWIPGIGGKSFGMNLRPVSLPQVPYLATGAVLPPNKPFLAVVGDQKNGTNVEAPLSVIQDAVAEVMGANLQGQDSANELLRRILQAVEGIQIGDDTIGRAARRYESRMVRMGGAL